MRNSFLILPLLFLMLLAGKATAALSIGPELGWEEPEQVQGVQIRLDGSRAYGLVVGDVMGLQVELELDPGLTLEPSSVPVPREILPWLHLRDASVEQGQTPAGGLRYLIRIDYQVFEAPSEVVTRRFQGPTLVVSGAGGTFDVPLPDWRFTVSPLLGRAWEREAGNRQLMPAMLPPPDDPGLARPAMLLSAAASLGLASVLLFTGPLSRRRRQAPFMLARRRLRQLRRTPAGMARSQEALRAMHLALDAHAGYTVFPDTLAQMLDEQPRFAPERAGMEAFFKDSRGIFFSGGKTHDHDALLLRLERLAVACARREARA